MQSGHADVLVHNDLRAEQLRPNSRLVEHRAVGGAGREHGDDTTWLRHCASDPDEPRELVLPSVVVEGEHRAPRVQIRAGDEHAAGAALEQRPCDRGHLLRCLPLCEDRFGRALPELTVHVDPGEAEIAEGQLRELLERALRLDLAASYALEELFQVLAQARHEADTLRARWSRSAARPGLDGLFLGSRTRPCCAARAASSTISSRSRTPVMPRSSVRSSRTRACARSTS